MVLTFDDGIGTSLKKTCDYDSYHNTMHLAHAEKVYTG